MKRTPDVWVVVSTHRDDGDDIRDDPERCFATRELAEQVAALDGGVVEQWTPVTELPAPYRRIRRSIGMYSDGSIYKAETVEYQESYFAHDATSWWRGTHVSKMPGTRWHNSITVEMWCEDTPENAAWWLRARDEALFNPAAVIARGTHYDRPTEEA